MSETSTYKTLKRPVRNIMYKDRGSKFIGDAFPVKNEDEAQQKLMEVRETHAKANHHCYAYSLGYDEPYIRYNDDGEPANSAGKPIYGQIYGYEITNVLVVVTRYFGGTKLGVGGLINAYKTTAQLCLDEAKIVKKIITKSLEVSCDYEYMNEILKIVKRENLSIKEQDLQLKCRYIIAVQKDKFDKIKQDFELVKGLNVKDHKA